MVFTLKLKGNALCRVNGIASQLSHQGKSATCSTVVCMVQLEQTSLVLLIMPLCGVYRSLLDNPSSGAMPCCKHNAMPLLPASKVAIPVLHHQAWYYNRLKVASCIPDMSAAPIQLKHSHYTGWPHRVKNGLV